MYSLKYSVVLYVAIIAVGVRGSFAEEESHASRTDSEVDHSIRFESAWRNRRAKIGTAKFAWSSAVFRSGQQFQGNGTSDVAIVNSEAFWLGDQDQRRLELLGIQKRVDDRKAVTLNTTYTDNGKQLWRELSLQPDDSPSPSGWIRAESWGQQCYLPVSLYCSRVQKLGDGADLRVIDNNYPVDGRSCVYFESTHQLGQRLKRIAVDPERDYVITQFDFLTVTNNLLLQFRIRYAPHPEFGWVPSHWTHANWNVDGSLFDHRQATVIDTEFNREYPLEHFEISFPTGTVVQDEVADKRFVVAEGLSVSQNALPVQSMNAALFRLLVIATCVVVVGAAVYARHRRTITLASPDPCE
ncbi:MAG: hypothetical protein WCJ09_06060 [Planctomycetota bacterium]